MANEITLDTLLSGGGAGVPAEIKPTDIETVNAQVEQLSPEQLARAEELKNSILQLAIQGRLVEQRPEERTAQELCQQIQAEKQRLIREGKIKKEKPLPEITEDEKPFEIPDGWMWVRIKEITILNPKNDLDDNLKTSFIPMTLLSDGYRSSYTYEIRSFGLFFRCLRWHIYVPAEYSHIFLHIRSIMEAMLPDKRRRA